VNIPDLTFIGAKAGKKGTEKRAAAPGSESTISDVNGDFVLGSAADNTVINGFTLTGAGSPSVNADAVEAFAGSSGLDLIDNVIIGNGNGVNMQNPDGTEPATISKNYIWNNNAEGDLGVNGETGTGVFISNGPANNTGITNNTFGEDSQTAINFAGAAGDPSVGLVVDGNNSTNDSTFVVAINSTNTAIEKNKIIVNGTVPGGAGTGILDFGANTGLHIASNTMSSNSDSSAAIGLTSYAGSASSDTTITGNRITGWNYGIYVGSGYDTALVSSNHLSTNGAIGIDVQSGTSSNVISQNKIAGDSGSATDCTDQSTGDLTAGTGNTWFKNAGSDHNSTPSGIC
jgi:hypothetical protein